MRRALRFLAVLAGVIVLVPDQTAHACPVCFQLEDSEATSGVYAAVFVLLGVTSGVLGGYGAFIVRFVRREKRGTNSEPDPAS